MKATTNKTRTLDVRTLMAQGSEPFAVIMATFAALERTETLLLITPFLPAPLIEKMRSENYEVAPERRGDGSWQTRFSRT